MTRGKPVTTALKLTCDFCRGDDAGARCYFCGRSLCGNCLRVVRYEDEYLDACSKCKALYDGRNPQQVQQMTLYQGLADKHWRRMAYELRSELEGQIYRRLGMAIRSEDIYVPSALELRGLSSEAIGWRVYYPMDGLRIYVVPQSAGCLHVEAMCTHCLEYGPVHEGCFNRYVWNIVDFNAVLGELPHTCDRCRKAAQQPRNRDRKAWWEFW